MNEIDLETFLRLGIDILRLVPLVMIFYIPALLGSVLMREKGAGYRKKAGIVFAGGFALILGVHLLIRSVSVEQVLATIGVSVLQIAVALLLALFTVYKLAD
jgi:ACR3 family arsenite efflux pump ArsB